MKKQTFFSMSKNQVSNWKTFKMSGFSFSPHHLSKLKPTSSNSKARFIKHFEKLTYWNYVKSLIFHLKGLIRQEKHSFQFTSKSLVFLVKSLGFFKVDNEENKCFSVCRKTKFQTEKLSKTRFSIFEKETRFFYFWLRRVLWTVEKFYSKN